MQRDQNGAQQHGARLAPAAPQDEAADQAGDDRRQPVERQPWAGIKMLRARRDGFHDDGAAAALATAVEFEGNPFPGLQPHDWCKHRIDPDPVTNPDPGIIERAARID